MVPGEQSEEMRNRHSALSSCLGPKREAEAWLSHSQPHNLTASLSFPWQSSLTMATVEAASPGDQRARSSFPGRRSCRHCSMVCSNGPERALSVPGESCPPTEVAGGGSNGHPELQQTRRGFQHRHPRGPNSRLGCHPPSKGDVPESEDGRRPCRMDTCCPAPEEPRKLTDRGLGTRPTDCKQSRRPRSQGAPGLVREGGSPLDEFSPVA